MLHHFQTRKLHSFTVQESDLAAFKTGPVHHVLSTFALAREAEYTCRLVLLDMLQYDEEGIGTRLEVNHHSPALPGSTVVISAQVDAIDGNRLTCAFNASVNGRVIATGKTGQMVLPRTKIEEIFNRLNAL